METQRPFVHQNGTTSPPVAPTIGDLLAVSFLERSIRFLNKGSAIDTKHEQMVSIAALLRWLQTPVINTTLGALQALAPSEQAMLNQVALALFDAGSKRPRLIAEIRAALDRVTP